MAAQINQFLDGVSAELNRPQPPKIGDSLNIAFTSTTGEKVDLASMKGKVVLVDFWAYLVRTLHCRDGPMSSRPYDKFHDKGFEIIGISLDQDKDALEKYTKEKQDGLAPVFRW